MLWQKSWLETRWRFLIGAILLSCSAAVTVFTYPTVKELLSLVQGNATGALGRQIRESAELARTFPGYIWSESFAGNQRQWITLFAILLGTASFLSTSGGASFTLSLPVSRRRLLAVRTSTGLAELFILAMFPALLIPLLAPAIGESHGVASALIHGFCLFIVATIFYNLGFLLSTIFSDPWRPVLIAIGVAVALGFLDRVLRFTPLSLFDVMSAERYFRHGAVPWAGLLVSVAIAAGLYSVAVANLVRRDF
ncbi:MAG TPA: hypothetical protein VGQ76_07045 [Thermoanaerobaculia bacterium]|jgi:hypothetical protein|nr:hypothetical protein [Thermoanaerobaculia bacterium]